MSRSLHRPVGWLTLAAFVGTGIYMKLRFPDAYRGNEVIHHLFRANHIYLLMSSMVNLTLATYLTPASTQGRQRLQRVGSTFVLLAPAVLLAAFVKEPLEASEVRPLTSVGVLAIAAGVMMHVLAMRKHKPFQV